MSQHSFVVLAFVIVVAGCGGDGGSGIDPTDVHFGDTALVVVLNPVVNNANRHGIATPGDQRAEVVVRTDDGATDVTAADGIAVLAPLTAGVRTVTVSGGGLDGSLLGRTYSFSIARP
jgi:D-serine dehydratase